VTRQIITRAEWGARPPKRTFTRRWRETQGIVIHHSGVKDGPTGVTALKQFERFHMDTRGWTAIAYNWLVDVDGTVYHGRGPGIIGGATRGYNSTTESICYIGWGNDPVPDEALRSIKWLTDHLQSAYGPGLWVKRHRDFASTSCPGHWLAKWVSDGMPLPDGSPEPDLLAVLQYLHFLTKQVERRSLSRWRRSRGDAVKVAQERLVAHGHNPGPIDGIFGRKTAAAVNAFQQAAGLKTNGVVDSQTWTALLKP
jgi:hypothetical protein